MNSLKIYASREVIYPYEAIFFYKISLLVVGTARAKCHRLNGFMVPSREPRAFLAPGEQGFLALGCMPSPGMRKFCLTVLESRGPRPSYRQDLYGFLLRSVKRKNSFSTLRNCW